MIKYSSIIALVVVGIAVITYVVFQRSDSDPTPPEFTDFGGVGTGDVTPTASDGTFRLVLESGKLVEVPDVRALPTTRDLGGGFYALDAQDLFTRKAFSITYSHGDRSFVVSLNEEPLAEAREQMEAYMKSSLGLSEAELCELPVLVGVPHDVNQFVSGEQLGFSFCPGSVQLD